MKKSIKSYAVSALNVCGDQQIFFWNLSLFRAKDLQNRLIEIGASNVKIEVES